MEAAKATGFLGTPACLVSKRKGVLSLQHHLRGSQEGSVVGKATPNSEQGVHGVQAGGGLGGLRGSRLYRGCFLSSAWGWDLGSLVVV